MRGLPTWAWQGAGLGYEAFVAVSPTVTDHGVISLQISPAVFFVFYSQIFMVFPEFANLDNLQMASQGLLNQLDMAIARLEGILDAPRQEQNRYQFEVYEDQEDEEEWDAETLPPPSPRAYDDRCPATPGYNGFSYDIESDEETIADSDEWSLDIDGDGDLDQGDGFIIMGPPAPIARLRLNDYRPPLRDITNEVNGRVANQQNILV